MSVSVSVVCVYVCEVCAMCEGMCVCVCMCVFEYMCVHVHLLKAGYILEQILFLLKFGLRENLIKGAKLDHIILLIALALSLEVVLPLSTQCFLLKNSPNVALLLDFMALKLSVYIYYLCIC